MQVVHRAITRFLLDQAGLKAEQADSGAVTLIQRFGKTRRRSPRMKLVWAAIDPQQAAAEPKDRISGSSRALPGAVGRKKCV